MLFQSAYATEGLAVGSVSPARGLLCVALQATGRLIACQPVDLRSIHVHAQGKFLLPALQLGMGGDGVLRMECFACLWSIRRTVCIGRRLSPNPAVSTQPHRAYACAWLGGTMRRLSYYDYVLWSIEPRPKAFESKAVLSQSPVYYAYDLVGYIYAVASRAVHVVLVFMTEVWHATLT